MLQSVGFFIDERRNNPVKEFIEALSFKEQTKVRAYLNELKNQGHNLRRPMGDYLGEGIYELRPRHNRIFYFFFLREHAVLLHAIRKKTDQILSGDIDLCLKRKMQVEAGGDIEEIDL
ncbi:MAG TPA: type II toxin-antitoxin system RelE/ParE family toxin [Candidatus Omnitrophota bacterium]|nr:type II toxin-antitoxin system RelE/ParE family toxin [Candidatus Omnitrophota bacterium]